MDCEMHACAGCGRTLQKEAFAESQWHHRYQRSATCMDCATKAKMEANTHACARCERELQKEAFTGSQWLPRHVRGATCMD
eukprot:2261988-Karenia_brevis.AAC.1